MMKQLFLVLLFTLCCSAQAIRNSLDPYGDALNAGLSAQAGIAININDPDWYAKYQAGRTAKIAKKLAQSKPVAQKPEDPYKNGLNLKDPLHPVNYFDKSAIGKLTNQQRLDRYNYWMFSQAEKYLTPTGIASFKLSRLVAKDNIFGLDFDLSEVLRLEAASINSKAPITVDSYTRLDSATAPGGARFMFHYTITKDTNMSSDQLMKEMKPMLTNKLCTDPNSAVLWVNNVEVIHAYYLPNGTFYNAINIPTANVCR
jgi:hypothetical protein